MSPTPPQDIDYHRLFDGAVDAFLVADHAGRYIEVNRAAVRLTGYSRDELLTMRVGDLTVDHERKDVDRYLHEVLSKGDSWRQTTVVRKNRSHIKVDARAIDMGNGLYMDILRDISERVENEEKLRESLDAYEVLVNLCNAAVISADSDMRITSWNRAAQALFGYNEEQAIGMSILVVCPGHLKQAHREGYLRHVRDDVSLPFGRTISTEGLKRDGTEVPIEVAIAVGEEGSDRVFTAVIHDVTEERRVLDQLNDALQRLQFHVDRMPLSYIVWSEEFRVVEWNPAAERIFGYTKAEAAGRHAYELIVPKEARAHVDKVWNDLLHGDTSSHSINANVRKDGSVITCEWFNTPLRDSHGNISSVASMTMDISQREATEVQIRIAQKLESLGVMAGGIAHDFNSALMVILGNAELIRSIRGLPKRAQEHLALIDEAGLRARNMIRHFISYAQTGRHDPEMIDLNTLVHDTAIFVQSSIGKSYELVVRTEKQLPFIYADRSQIGQILINLCLNAQQAMEGGGTITVTTCTTKLNPQTIANCLLSNVKPSDYVELSVADTGCGMDKSTMSRIFDPYFTTKANGHGLGLAAVPSMLRQHRATIRIESAPGKGSQFHVYFPVHDKQSKR